jgi:RNA recognition motif-containing protein
MTDLGPSLTRCQRRVANMNIYVGNLSLDVTEEELRREFMAFGAVISVVIMNDKYIGSGQTRGYGFVEMASKSEGEVAITSLKGKELRNQAIDVVGALPLSDKRGIESLHARINNQFNRKVRQRRY